MSLIISRVCHSQRGNRPRLHVSMCFCQCVSISYDVTWPKYIFPNINSPLTFWRQSHSRLKSGKKNIIQLLTRASIIIPIILCIMSHIIKYPSHMSPDYGFMYNAPKTWPSIASLYKFFSLTISFSRSFILHILLFFELWFSIRFSSHFLLWKSSPLLCRYKIFKLKMTKACYMPP